MNWKPCPASGPQKLPSAGNSSGATAGGGAHPAQTVARLPVPSPPVPSPPLPARPSGPAPTAVATETKAALRASSQGREELGELTDQEEEAWVAMMREGLADEEAAMRRWLI